jgi:hypothetical protein
MEPYVLRCRQCEGEMTMGHLGPIEGEEHGVHLKIEGMPAMQCAKGHKRFVAPTFPMKLLDELLADPQLAPLEPAEEKGLLRRRFCCPACSAVLDSHGNGRVETVLRSIELEGLARFGVRIDLPTYRCPSCGHEYVEPRETMVTDLMKASAHAFRSAEIAPG